MGMFDKTPRGFDTVISEGTSLTGGVLQINGTALVNGEINESKVAADNLIVSKSGVMKVEHIFAKFAQLDGTIEADELKVEGALVIGSTAKIKANVIKYGKISICENALVSALLQSMLADSSV